MFLLLLSFYLTSEARQNTNGKISGHIKLDSSWDSIIYLSHIPTFDDMYFMSVETIISKATIDSLGYFEFDIGFLPAADNLFRLHITKKGDVPASLVIGGKDENHLFLIANRFSNIKLETKSYSPPFKKVIFKESAQNIDFQKVTDFFYQNDSIASESSASKRSFIENKLYDESLIISDSSKNPLVSLYAIYKGKFEARYSSNPKFYDAYLEKWRNENSPYFASFRNKVEKETPWGKLLLIISFGCIIFTLGFFVGKRKKKNFSIEKLSTQERKIFELLKQGATNQEISDQYHIEISTVKSHVSNILSKLNMKSRKDVMNA